MGERTPHNDPRARAAFLGMRLDTTRADMTQAVLEGVAYALNDCLNVVRSEELSVGETTICGGGANSPLWQAIMADVLGIPLRVPKTRQSPALGAAILASVTCGLFDDVASAASAVVRMEDDLVMPNRQIISLYQGRYNVWHSLYPAIKDFYQQIL
jgi:xylulokinase